MRPAAQWSDDAGRAVLSSLLPDDRVVLPSLQAVQEAFGFVPEPAVALVAHELNVSVADVHGVLTYYPDLRREAPAPVTVRLCAAEACTAVGGGQLADDVRALAGDGVDVGHVYCLGLCAVGPAVIVTGTSGERLVGRATLDRVHAAVDDLAAEEAS